MYREAVQGAVAAKFQSLKMKSFRGMGPGETCSVAQKELLYRKLRRDFGGGQGHGTGMYGELTLACKFCYVPLPPARVRLAAP